MSKRNKRLKQVSFTNPFAFGSQTGSLSSCPGVQLPGWTQKDSEKPWTEFASHQILDLVRTESVAQKNHMVVIFQGWLQRTLSEYDGLVGWRLGAVKRTSARVNPKHPPVCALWTENAAPTVNQCLKTFPNQSTDQNQLKLGSMKWVSLSDPSGTDLTVVFIIISSSSSIPL